MLAVTAGDGACGENSTQPTARGSQVVFTVPDTGVGPLMGHWASGKETAFPVNSTLSSGKPF